MTKTERRRLYRRVLNTKDGAELLKDLRDTFDCDGLRFVPIPNREQAVAYDTHHAAIRDGQAQVYHHLKALSDPEEKETKKPEITK